MRTLSSLKVLSESDSWPEGDNLFKADQRLPLQPVPDDPGDSTVARLRLLVEPRPAIVWTTDRDLVFMRGLGSGHAFFGLRSTPGTSLFDYYGTRDPDALPIRAHRLALGGESVSYEQESQGRTYQTRVEPLRDEARTIIGCIAVAVDITERQRAEEALYREKER